VDSERGVVGLRLLADKLPDFILPNMTIDVNIEVKRTSNAFALPTSAILLGGQPRVLALAEGRLVPRPVEVIGRNPDWAAIEGLEPATQVLRVARLGRPGQRVSPADPSGRPGRP
jgi:multidrug efflux pump subunit AcrA (membrane-fusion protein)